MPKLNIAAVSLVFTVTAVSAGAASPAVAGQTQVATIGGCYDCLGNYDTPVLFFNNTTGGTLNNAQIVLNGYQGLNNGRTATVSLGSLGSGTTNFAWGSLPGVPGGTTPFSLTAYDYDDEFGGTAYAIPTNDCGQPAGCVAGGGPYWYAHTGNFSVTFTATVSGGQYDGQSVYSVFSPQTNATGGFIGWEGLDPNGYSESPYDIHSGTVTGDLANIFLGTVPAGVPEPATWGMMIAGFGLVAGALRVRGRRIAAV